jgi:hypothetical protein
MHSGLANQRVITIGINTVDLVICLGAVLGANSSIFGSNLSVEFSPSTSSGTFDIEDLGGLSESK